MAPDCQPSKRRPVLCCHVGDFILRTASGVPDCAWPAVAVFRPLQPHLSNTILLRQVHVFLNGSFLYFFTGCALLIHSCQCYSLIYMCIPSLTSRRSATMRTMWPLLDRRSILIDLILLHCSVAILFAQDGPEAIRSRNISARHAMLAMRQGKVWCEGAYLSQPSLLQ